EGLGQPLDRLVGGTVAPVRLRARAGHAPEQVLGPLRGQALIILHQVAPLQHGDGIGAQVERTQTGRSGHAGSSLSVRASESVVMCWNLTGRRLKKRGRSR